MPVLFPLAQLAHREPLTLTLSPPGGKIQGDRVG
jgi:hypothetical protein